MNESAETAQTNMQKNINIRNELAEELLSSQIRKNLQEENLNSQSLQGQGSYGQRQTQGQFVQKNNGFYSQQGQARSPISSAIKDCAPCPEPRQQGQAGPSAPPKTSPQTPVPSHAPLKPTVAYQAALPYPLVKVEEKNRRYATAMLDNLGGPVSEISAITGYFYNHLITGAFKEISETFHHISMVEMRHMEIFGELAVKLGENPRLWSRRGRGGQYIYWSPACLRYPPFPILNTSSPDFCPPEPSSDCSYIPLPKPASQRTNAALKALLSQSIESEQEAINKYMQQTSWIKDVNVCDNLRRIAADEQMHLNILTQLYHKYCS